MARSANKPATTSKIDELADAVISGKRRALARAITLVESSRHEHRADAKALLAQIMPNSGNAIRIGVSGVPGVGKSSFIEAFGEHIIEQGHRLAVLAVDPSSGRTGGSVLGDKTRMARLASNPSAFIRPSPSAGTLGGVARRTRESILLCEAAGYDVVLVETVGVGQSEYAVADMTDMFLLLMLPGGGDELQGMKRGIMELADLILVNKADGELRAAATRAAADYANALRLFRPRVHGWTVPVESCRRGLGPGGNIQTAVHSGRKHRQTARSAGPGLAVERDQRGSERRTNVGPKSCRARSRAGIRRRQRKGSGGRRGGRGGGLFLTKTPSVGGRLNKGKAK
jgi:LAO/AO transport system kinase